MLSIEILCFSFLDEPKSLWCLRSLICLKSDHERRWVSDLAFSGGFFLNRFQFVRGVDLRICLRVRGPFETYETISAETESPSWEIPDISISTRVPDLILGTPKILLRSRLRKFIPGNFPRRRVKSQRRANGTVKKRDGILGIPVRGVNPFKAGERDESSPGSCGWQALVKRTPGGIESDCQSF